MVKQSNGASCQVQNFSGNWTTSTVIRSKKIHFLIIPSQSQNKKIAFFLS